MPRLLRWVAMWVDPQALLYPRRSNKCYSSPAVEHLIVDAVIDHVVPAGLLPDPNPDELHGRKRVRHERERERGRAREGGNK